MYEISLIILGVIIGYSLAKNTSGDSVEVANEDEKEIELTHQQKEKKSRKEKIIEFLQTNERVTNNDVEKLSSVSDATATRYLDELEKEGKIQQTGTTGHAVFYTPKNQ